MDTLALLAVAAIVLAAFSYALLPLIRPPEALADGAEDPGAEEIARLLSERERAYRDIQEIDMDREMGKLSEEDYADMIGRARAGALQKDASRSRHKNAKCSAKTPTSRCVLLPMTRTRSARPTSTTLSAQVARRLPCAESVTPS